METPIFKRPDGSIVKVYSLNGIPYLREDPRMTTDIAMPVLEMELDDGEESMPPLIEHSTD